MTAPILVTDLKRVAVHAVLQGNFRIACTGPAGESFEIDPMEYGGDIEFRGTLDELIPKLVTAMERRLRGDLCRKRLEHGDALIQLASRLPSSHDYLLGEEVEERERHTPFGELSRTWDAATQTAKEASDG